MACNRRRQTSRKSGPQRRGVRAFITSYVRSIAKRRSPPRCRVSLSSRGRPDRVGAVTQSDPRTSHHDRTHRCRSRPGERDERCCPGGGSLPKVWSSVTSSVLQDAVGHRAQGGLLQVLAVLHCRPSHSLGDVQHDVIDRDRKRRSWAVGGAACAEAALGPNPPFLRPGFAGMGSGPWLIFGKRGRVGGRPGPTPRGPPRMVPGGRSGRTILPPPRSPQG